MPKRMPKNLNKRNQRRHVRSRLEKRVDGLDRKLGTFQRRMLAFQRQTNTHFKKVDSEFKKVRREMKESFAKFEAKIQKQFITFGNMLLSRIEMIEQNDAKFRNEVLTMMDVVRKDYDVFTQEKMALGVGQKRLEKEIDLLKESDSRQNETIDELDVRVTELESV